MGMQLAVVPRMDVITMCFCSSWLSNVWENRSCSRQGGADMNKSTITTATGEEEAREEGEGKGGGT